MQKVRCPVVGCGKEGIFRGNADGKSVYLCDSCHKGEIPKLPTNEKELLDDKELDFTNVEKYNQKRRVKKNKLAFESLPNLLDAIDYNQKRSVKKNKLAFESLPNLLDVIDCDQDILDWPEWRLALYTMEPVFYNELFSSCYLETIKDEEMSLISKSEFVEYAPRQLKLIARVVANGVLAPFLRQ